MISFTNTIRIRRSPVDVYAYLSDLEHTPEWNWAIAETTKTTKGPATVGTRYRQIRTVPEPATETIEIAALDANRHIEVQGTLAAMRARLDYELTEVADGTEIVNTVQLEPQGALRLTGPVLGPRIKSAVASNLVDLKTRLEEQR